MVLEAREHYRLEDLYRKRLRAVPGKEAKDHADHHFAEVFIALGKDPKVAETVFEIGERFGAISAERLLEASINNLDIPQFDFFKLAGLFRDAHRRMGRLAAGYWAKSYGEVVKTGFDPDEYFRAVDKMAEIGGNKLSGYYAYVFPDLLKSGENPYIARSHATQLNARGGLPIARSYLLSAPDVSKMGHVSAEEYGEFSVRSLDEYGKDLGYWAVRGSAGAVLCSVPLGSFKGDIDEMIAKYPKNGEKVASWFASGYKGLGETKKPLFKELETELLWLERTDPSEKERYAFRVECVNDARKRILEPNNYPYKKHYLELVDELGLSGGIFLVKAINGGRAVWRAREISYLDQLPGKLLEARQTLSKQALSKLLWFGSKMHGRPELALGVVEDCLWAARDFGEKVMLESLVYSAKRTSKGGDARGFMIPHGTGKLLSGDNDPEGNWQNLLSRFE